MLFSQFILNIKEIIFIILWEIIITNPIHKNVVFIKCFEVILD